MKTTEQSEKLRGATAQEEQQSDPGEEQTTPSPEEEEQKAQETSATAESPSADVSSEPETAKAEDASAPEASATPRKKRKKKVEEPFDEKAASPRPSYWPIVLAFSLCVMFLGVAWHPIMMGVGVVMVITALIGWSLERR